MPAVGPEPAGQVALALDGADGSEAPLVEVAVDAPGVAGARAYTYHLPPALVDIAPGEAVLVEFARRQAIGIVLARTDRHPGVATRPVRDRVRADGPLLPPLTLTLARWVAGHYLAPPAATIRSVLPPGLLERLELVAELTPLAVADTAPTAAGDPGQVAAAGTAPTGAGALDPADADLLDALRSGPRRIRDLPAPDGRPGLLRRLRSLAERGSVALDWTLLAATAGPRYIRWIVATEAGLAADRLLRAGSRPAGRPLGPRQVAALAELAAAPTGLAGADLAARHGSATIAGLARRDLVRVEIRERERDPLARRSAGRRGARPPDSVLTGPQAAAVDAIRSAIMGRDPRPLLLDGVTGGGKTAVYVEAIAASLGTGRPALVLVPEIALAMPLVDRLRADLAAEVALLHSALGAGERADEWRRIRAGGADVVVGTRMAVLAPLDDVGVVIVDEEHDPAYKSDRTPRLQARDTAIRLGEMAGAAVVLGSATPAVETVWRAQTGAYERVRLPGRPAGTAPTVEVVDLRAELAAGNRGLISTRLATALEVLDPARGDRAILVLNRRGTASVVLCRDCGHVQACPECGRPLVFHQAGYTLRCHHCGTAAPLAARCPACGSPRIRYLGGGTERVEREVTERFPRLRVGRLDRDVVERRGAAVRVVDAFADGRLDILVGTSLVTKGLDIPEVTLVGVVSADVALNLPDERAAERTYQLLAQAVGRAGRGREPGLAILQTYQPTHPAIQAVARGDGDAFYAAELDLRRRFGSPPFGRLVKLTVALADRAAAEATAADRAERLRDAAATAGLDIVVAGPAPAFIARRADRWRFDVVLRGTDPTVLLGDGLEPPWTVDVDPESLL
jgi:primosomal protein N' (replication factor Y)